MRNIRKGMLLLRKGHLDQLENSEYLSLTDAERGQRPELDGPHENGPQPQHEAPWSVDAFNLTPTSLSPSASSRI
jgi:hypothetical protein